jgi:hypothetical protein
MDGRTANIRLGYLVAQAIHVGVQAPNILMIHKRLKEMNDSLMS